jgi:hypothetical protein
MRYQCFIYDEDGRLDARLRSLFADFGQGFADTPDRAAAPVRRDEPAATPPEAASAWRPSPTERMW